MQAAARMKSERNVDIRPEWILGIIRKETEDVVRPKFEQHILSNSNRKMPQEDVSELRYRASFDTTGSDPYARHESGDFYNLTGFFPQAGRNFLAGVTVRF